MKQNKTRIIIKKRRKKMKKKIFDIPINHKHRKERKKENDFLTYLN